MLKRDGTVVHIPFLTTATGYEHALVMVNRNPADVKYTVKFVDEAGGTSTAGDMAEGMLKKDAVTNIPATDLVTIEGHTSTSATVTIVSDPAKVAVMTTLRNTGTGTYDSVLFEPVAR